MVSFDTVYRCFDNRRIVTWRGIFGRMIIRPYGIVNITFSSSRYYLFTQTVIPIALTAFCNKLIIRLPHVKIPAPAVNRHNRREIPDCQFVYRLCTKILVADNLCCSDGL